MGSRKIASTKKPPAVGQHNFTHLVEYVNAVGKFTSKFINHKSARLFAKRMKDVGLVVSLYEISPKNKLKEVKFR